MRHAVHSKITTPGAGGHAGLSAEWGTDISPCHKPILASTESEGTMQTCALRLSAIPGHHWLQQHPKDPPGWARPEVWRWEMSRPTHCWAAPFCCASYPRVSTENLIKQCLYEGEGNIPPLQLPKVHVSMMPLLNHLLQPFHASFSSQVPLLHTSFSLSSFFSSKLSQKQPYFHF